MEFNFLGIINFHVDDFFCRFAKKLRFGLVTLIQPKINLAKFNLSQN